MTAPEAPSRVGWAGDFSYEYYRRLLRKLDSQFEIQTFTEFVRSDGDPTGVVVLRHDVDVSLERAVDLARVERDAGVRSTYTLIPNTPLYDVEKDAEMVRTIERLGHEIGLHYAHEYEKPAFDDDGLDFQQEIGEIRRVRRRLESIVTEPVNVLSFHLPTDEVLEGPQTIAGMINAYSCEMMGTYLSDSTGRWREGPPIKSIESVEDAAFLHVLTHPVWWGELHKTPITRYIETVEAFETISESMYDELVAIYPQAKPYIDTVRNPERTYGASATFSL